MELTKNQRDRLQAALNDMCASKDDVDDLTSRAFNLSVEQITTASGGVPALLRDVVRAAEKMRSGIAAEEMRSGVGDLIDAAIEVLEEAPGMGPLPAAHPLKQLLSELGERIFEERQNLLETAWLLGDRVLLDRGDLRTKVGSLGQAETGKHILVVQGKRASGRSYSLELIRYLQDRLRDFQVIWVDMARLVDLNDDRDLRPEDLGQEIADQMMLGQVPARQNEKDAKWANRFCNWLTPFVQDTEKRYWIVLDSFDKKLLPQGIHDLVGAIAERIEINLGQLRLVLLSYDKELPAQVQGGLEVEDIASQVGPKDVAEFFFQLYEERRKRKSVPYTDPDVAASVQTVLQAVDFSSEQYLQELHKKIIEVAGPIRAGSIGGGP